MTEFEKMEGAQTVTVDEISPPETESSMPHSSLPLHDHQGSYQWCACKRRTCMLGSRHTLRKQHTADHCSSVLFEFASRPAHCMQKRPGLYHSCSLLNSLAHCKRACSSETDIHCWGTLGPWMLLGHGA